MPDDPTRSGDNMPPFVRVGAQIGSYRIESYIDQGGMASVYAATDLNLNRRVALKVLARDLSDTKDFRERFVRESRFAASLDHPNIVPIYDAGEADGFLYIAMRSTSAAGTCRSFCGTDLLTGPRAGNSSPGGARAGHGACSRSCAP